MLIIAIWANILLQKKVLLIFNNVVILNFIIMTKYNIHDLSNTLKKSNEKVVLFGAGVIGEISFYAMRQIGIDVDFFCDSSETKQGKSYFDIKTISPEELAKFKTKTNIFITNNYVSTISSQLKKKNFSNIYDCVGLLEKTNFNSNSNLSVAPLKIERLIAFYKNMCMKDEYTSNGTLNIKSLDIQITERCSLRCKDCSNLMQYYTKPVNNELNLMLKSIERFMSCVDKVYEFRVLGGDPFVNKELYKVINNLVKYEKVKKIAIYTNAKIIPKGENLTCLQNKKVILDVTNYGKVSSKHDEIIKVLEDNNIAYTSARVTTWQDCGRILPFQKRTKEEVSRVFNNCCNSDLLSLLHGKLYRCPFSANATNLKAIPYDSSDIVDLSDDKISLEDLKLKIKQLTYDKKSLTACNFCNGRDYKTPALDAAIQAIKPLSYSIENENNTL